MYYPVVGLVISIHQCVPILYFLCIADMIYQLIFGGLFTDLIQSQCTV